MSDFRNVPQKRGASAPVLQVTQRAEGMIDARCYPAARPEP
jgi:hypothetical protein